MICVIQYAREPVLLTSSDETISRYVLPSDYGFQQKAVF